MARDTSVTFPPPREHPSTHSHHRWVGMGRGGRVQECKNVSGHRFCTPLADLNFSFFFGSAQVVCLPLPSLIIPSSFLTAIKVRREQIPSSTTSSLISW